MSESDACEMPNTNPTSTDVNDLLKDVRTIAVVGLSDKPHRDSHRVAAYMQQQGYRIIPIHPGLAASAELVLGEKAYARLEDVPETIDLVNVFRRPEHVPEIVESTLAIKARALWLQLGIVHNEAADRARTAGLQVVQNKCLMVEHRNL